MSVCFPYYIIELMTTVLRVAVFFIFFCCLAGCSAKRLDLSHHTAADKTDITIIQIKNVDYDQHGLPLFLSVLSRRPEKAGEQFTLVYLVDGKPVKSFNVLIVEQKADLMRPLNVLYSWTENGFKVGTVLGLGAAEAAGRTGGKEGLYSLAAAVVLPIAGGAAGFIIGTWAIIPPGMEELKNLLTTDREALISFTEYTYDKQGRVKVMKMFQPGDKPIELVRTDFVYTRDERTPSQTTVISFPERKTRVIP